MANRQAILSAAEAVDAAKLASLADGATTRQSLGLDLVNNTADADKPVSTAQQTALDKKVEKADLDSVSLRSFGAALNGSTLDDAAWVALFAAHPTGSVKVTIDGYCRISGPITPPAGCSNVVLDFGGGGYIYSPNHNFDFLHLPTTVSGWKLISPRFYSDNGGTGATGKFMLLNESNDLTVYDLWVRNCWSGLSNSGAKVAFYGRSYFNGIKAASGSAVLLDMGSSEHFVMQDIFAENAAGADCLAGVQVLSGNSIIIGGTVAKCGTPLLLNPAAGKIIATLGLWPYFNGDTSSGNGVWFAGAGTIQRVEGVLRVSSNAGAGVVVANSPHSADLSIRAVQNGGHGVTLTSGGTQYNSRYRVTAYGNALSGFNAEPNCTNFSADIQGGAGDDFGGNGQYSAVIGAGCDNWAVSVKGTGDTLGLYYNGAGTGSTKRLTANGDLFGGGDNLTVTPVGSAVRTLYDRLREFISVKDFGAKGDGATDDTAAIQAAFAYAAANRADIYFPAGSYITGPITQSFTSYAYMPRIYGAGRTSTIVTKKAGSGTGPVFTLGSAAATNNTSGIRVERMTVDGVSAAASSAAILINNPVRCRVSDVVAKNAADQIKFLGGVSSTVRDSTLQGGNRGFVADLLTGGAAGTNYPNNHAIRGSTITGCATRGLDFDNGRLLVIDHVEFDSCGTVGVPTTGAIRVGSNIDVEGGNTDAVGIHLTSCWFEANAGAASIILLSGRNVIERPNFIANPNASYDIYVGGGTYALSGAKFSSVSMKAPAIYEDTGAGAGNLIEFCPDLGNLNAVVSAAKTSLNGAGRSYTVATLTTPVGALRSRAFVSDSTVAASGNFGALLTGGGANTVPVYFDGANWRIG